MTIWEQNEEKTRLLIRQAGESMLSCHDLVVTGKGRHADFVTQEDKLVQEMLMDGLHRLYPEARFMAEEKENAALTDEPTFIIDPIDGTTNYFRRREASVISVGLAEGKKPVRGWIYNPYRGELFTAAKGQGAFCNGKPVHVSAVPRDNALVYMGTAAYYEELMSLTGLCAQRLLPEIADFRRTGSCALEMCDIARGWAEALFEWRLQPWDICAGVLLVEEAGGRCCDILGEEPDLTRPAPLLAANAACFEPLLERLRNIRREWAELQEKGQL